VVWGYIEAWLAPRTVGPCPRVESLDAPVVVVDMFAGELASPYRECDGSTVGSPHGKTDDPARGVAQVVVELGDYASMCCKDPYLSLSDARYAVGPLRGIYVEGDGDGPAFLRGRMDCSTLPRLVHEDLVDENIRVAHLMLVNDANDVEWSMCVVAIALGEPISPRGQHGKSTRKAHQGSNRGPSHAATLAQSRDRVDPLP
jgi:hypothetical protein